MKQSYWIMLLLLFFILIVPMKEMIYSVLNKENNLVENVVLQSDYLSLKQDYERLLEFNSLKEESVLISKVVMHDPYRFYEQVTILKGMEDGIGIGDIIYNEVGFIGRVAHVNKHSSIVNLFTYPNTRMAVYINDNYGVLEVEMNQLVIRNIVSNHPISVGDIAYTSAKSEINRSIPIAKVLAVEEGVVEKILIVEPVVDLFDLNYIYVGKCVAYE